MAKKLVSGPILARSAEIWAANFIFSKIELCQSLDIKVCYYHVQYQEKLIIRSDRQTDGQTDGQTD